ncbi:MAG: hypothetical protein RL409_980 [Gemmatimonadota bacterium]|jgi:hypothetical protein
MANEVIGIDVQVKLEQLRAQLATLGPGMDKEAKAMTAALNKEIKAQTAAIKKQAADMAATNGVKKLGDQAEDAGVKFDKLGMAMGPIGGVISKISPEAGSLASVVAGLTSGFQGLAAAGGGSMASLAPFAAILAPIALGIGVVAGVMADMEREAEESATAMEGLVRAMQAVDDMTAGAADALTDFKVKTGQMTSTEAAYQKAIKQVAAEYTTANAAIEESIRLRIASGHEAGLADDVASLREQATALKASTEARARALAGEMEWAEEVRKSGEYIAERDKAAAKGAKAAAEAARSAAAAERERVQAAAEAQAKIDASDKYTSDRFYEQMEAEDKRREQSARKRMKLAEEARDAELQAIEEVEAAERASREAAIATASSLSDLASSASDALGQYAESVSKKNKKAARDAFAVGKVVAISSTLVNTALAVTNALATVPYPAAPIAAAAAAVAGGVQVATIAAEKPSFHRGGLVEERGRGEVSATLLPGESVLNRQATSSLGAGGVAALNNGGGGGGSVSLRIGRLEAREIIRTDVASGGLVVQAARSAAAKGGNLAGRSGRRPIG